MGGWPLQAQLVLPFPPTHPAATTARLNLGQESFRSTFCLVGPNKPHSKVERAEVEGNQKRRRRSRPGFQRVTSLAPRRVQVSEAAQPSPRLLRPQSDANGASQHPGFVRPSAPSRRDPRPRGRGASEWVPSLTWGGGARSWPLVKASDATAPPRADSERTGLCSGDRHAHPHGPGLWPPRG